MSGRLAAAWLFVLLSSSSLHGAEVTVTWDPNSESDLAGYKVYWGRKSGTYTGVTDVASTTTTCEVAGLEEGATYYFAVQAYDTSGLHSEFSVEVEAIAVGPRPPVAVPGLVAAFGFDENSGASASDSSGRGHHGQVSGAVWTAGRFGRALRFDGVDDWVTVAATSALNLADAMTLEAWVYPTASGGWRTIAFKEAPAEEWRHTYGLYSTFGTEGAGGHVLLARYANVHDVTALPLDRWSHIAMTYDGAAVRYFLNGVERGRIAASGGVRVSSGELRIGGNAMWGDFFKGRIDELRVYERALTAAEIQRDMGTPVTGWLAAAYSFDDGSGSVAADDSGRSLDGQITVEKWTKGKFGNGLLFDGVNDWVTVAASPWLDLKSAMTLEAWVYPTALGGWRTVLMKEFGGWYSYGLYADGAAGPSGHAYVSTDASVRAGTPLPLHAWTHLAVTFDGTLLRLYVNGRYIGATPPLTGGIQASADALRIGGNSIWGEHFSGVIDEVRIYYRALSEAEIAADMQRPVR